ncbi:MAG: hypothetical protein IPH31_00435 [Lewinellaceae bacterium]|nr:hypothetical protein [Lewinellaceae bacterium]
MPFQHAKEQNGSGQEDEGGDNYIVDACSAHSNKIKIVVGGGFVLRGMQMCLRFYQSDHLLFAMRE